jgi:hypothetical protein
MANERGRATASAGGAETQRQNSSNAWHRREGQNRSRSECRNALIDDSDRREPAGSSADGDTTPSCVPENATTTGCPRCGMALKCPDFFRWAPWAPADLCPYFRMRL